MQDVFIKIHNAADTMHIDQTGHFPATFSRGNQYIMVLVEVDGNYIDMEPMKNKSEGAIIKAYLALWTRLTANGTVKPTSVVVARRLISFLKDAAHVSLCFGCFIR